VDLRQFNKYEGGNIAQFAPPENYELVGQTFNFVMDDGPDYYLTFIDNKNVEWSIDDGDKNTASDYICIKSDATTYLVSYELGCTPRANHTFVIDLENYLITMIISRVGENKRFPLMISQKFLFGAIAREGKDLPFKRHGFSSDVIGNVVQWNYGGMETVHVYYCRDYYRITYPPEKASSQVFNEAMAKLPSSDEPTTHVKIKEGVYFFSLTEMNMERLLGDAMPFRSNTMCFIQDYRKVYQIGRAFGTITDKPLHVTFASYGKILDPETAPDYIKDMLTAPNPYLV